MLDELRSATKELHEQLEEENLAQKIVNHQISSEEYKLLLLQNYIAYKITETEIEKYIPNYNSEKSAQLNLDLEALEVTNISTASFKEDFKLTSYEEALGAAYVVLGSALGGVYISKEIPNCPHLAEIPKPHFFNGDRAGVKAWNKFVKELKAKDFSEAQVKTATNKACETFEFFSRIFKEATLGFQTA
ncbi:heme oxygenase [Salegentibacter echinorum]|uniref:Heme oxygenase n=1 Tax=Salegentibacter echinorum TaxID=1073325 RepID=A0A1M5FMH8_SALEC|nr:biliverdin-producing heme oxygenase [Salegentibacter echinorum]SHF92362.1 heme oxygenase [Salegentibacter echinorum]